VRGGRQDEGDERTQKEFVRGERRKDAKRVNAPMFFGFLDLKFQIAITVYAELKYYIFTT